MRDIETQTVHILRRKQCCLLRRQARRLAAMGVAPSVTGGAQLPPGSALGAMILGPEVGGYGIVALIAFALGVVTAIMARKYRRMKEIEQRRTEDKDGGGQA